MPKRILHHFPLCPQSRLVRIIMCEKKLNFELKAQSYGVRDADILELNPSGELPILQENDGTLICGEYAIIEHLNESYPEFPLIRGDAPMRAEIRRIHSWFSSKFYSEVTKHIVKERVLKYLNQGGSPESRVLKVAKDNLKYHMQYIEFLLTKDRYICGNKFTLADVSVAAQLSIMDYLGEVSWQSASIKEWYAIVKSKPSMRPVLEDRVKGFRPPKYYDNADF